MRTHAHPTKFIDGVFGYREIKMSQKKYDYVAIVMVMGAGARIIDTALTVKKAKQRIKEYAASPLLFKI